MLWCVFLRFTTPWVLYSLRCLCVVTRHVTLTLLLHVFFSWSGAKKKQAVERRVAAAENDKLSEMFYNYRFWEGKYILFVREKHTLCCKKTVLWFPSQWGFRHACIRLYGLSQKTYENVSLTQKAHTLTSRTGFSQRNTIVTHSQNTCKTRADTHIHKRFESARAQRWPRPQRQQHPHGPHRCPRP